jgi:hypothetical protein
MLYWLCGSRAEQSRHESGTEHSSEIEIVAPITAGVPSEAADPVSRKDRRLCRGLAPRERCLHSKRACGAYLDNR